MASQRRRDEGIRPLSECELVDVQGGRISLNTYAPLTTSWVVDAPRNPQGLADSFFFVNFGRTGRQPVFAAF